MISTFSPAKKSPPEISLPTGNLSNRLPVRRIGGNISFCIQRTDCQNSVQQADALWILSFAAESSDSR